MTVPQEREKHGCLGGRRLDVGIVERLIPENQP